MFAYIKSEPAVFIALIGSLLALVATFGLSMSTEQTGALLAFMTLVLGFITRTQVSPATPTETAV